MTNNSTSSDFENGLCLSLSEHQCFSFFHKGKTKTKTAVFFFFFSQFRERSPSVKANLWEVVGSYSFFQLQDMEARSLNHTSGVPFSLPAVFVPARASTTVRLLQSPQSLPKECFPPSADSIVTNVIHGAGVQAQFNLGKQKSWV